MDLSNWSSGDHSNNFEFAFNSSNFSDRVLRIEIVSGAAESKSDGEGCNSIADWARHRNRRREDVKTEKDSPSKVCRDQPTAPTSESTKSYQRLCLHEVSSLEPIVTDQCFRPQNISALKIRQAVLKLRPHQ